MTKSKNPRQTKLDPAKQQIAKEIASHLHQNGLTQMQAAQRMKDAPSQVSLVVTGKLRGFSLERLLTMYVLLTGRGIVMSPTPATSRTRAVTFKLAA
jgi:predicted XRE-type DNA-binding protein